MRVHPLLEPGTRLGVRPTVVEIFRARFGNDRFDWADGRSFLERGVVKLHVDVSEDMEWFGGIDFQFEHRLVEGARFPPRVSPRCAPRASRRRVRMNGWSGTDHPEARRSRRPLGTAALGRASSPIGERDGFRGEKAKAAIPIHRPVAPPKKARRGFRWPARRCTGGRSSSPASSRKVGRRSNLLRTPRITRILGDPSGAAWVA